MEMTPAVEQFLSIGIVGAALSLAIQWVKAKWGVDGNTTKAIAIVGSIVVGSFVWFFSGTAIWASIIGVLAAASTVYAIVFSGVRKSDREDA